MIAVFFIDGEINVGESRAGDNIAARISERQRRIEREGAGIEELLHGMRAGVGIAGDIGAIVAEAGAALVRAGENGERLAGLRGDDSADLPAAAEPAREPRTTDA